MTVKTWNIEALTGYTPISTFYEDFSIADAFGVNAIRDTYERAFEAWQTDYKMLTELVMALNWKANEHYGRNGRYAQLYTELYYQADQWAKDNLTGEALSYYYCTTD